MRRVICLLMEIYGHVHISVIMANNNKVTYNPRMFYADPYLMAHKKLRVYYFTVENYYKAAQKVVFFSKIGCTFVNLYLTHDQNRPHIRRS